MMTRSNLDDLWTEAERSGRTEFRAYCPNCGRSQSDKTLSMNPSKRVAYCFRCEFTHKSEAPEGFVQKHLRQAQLEQDQREARFEAIRRSCKPVTSGDLVDHYLRNRLGADIPQLPRVGLGNYHRKTLQGVYEPYPAMVAPMMSPDGKCVAWHITNLTQYGEKAFGGDSRRYCKRQQMKGSAVRLYPATETLIVAEGIETALALHLINGDPVWACTNASLLKSFIPPEGVKTLLIGGDNDSSGVGQEAAWALYERLKGRVSCNVLIPEKENTDWLDEIREDV